MIENYFKTDTLLNVNDNIETLELIDPFNEEINYLPSKLKILIIKSKTFNIPFKIEFPKSLRVLILPLNYTHLIPVDNNLKEINFGYNWNPRVPFELPKKVETLTFGGQFEDLTNFFSNPPSSHLKNISLGGIFNKPLTPETTPYVCSSSSISYLKLSNKFDNKLDLRNMKALEIFVFNTNWNSLDYLLPQSLKEIHYGTFFNQPLDLSILPVSIKKIVLRKNFRNKVFSSNKKLVLDVLDLCHLDLSFPIFEFDLNTKVNNILINENQLFLLELYSEKNKDILLLKNSYNIIVIKDEKEILKLDSSDFSTFEENVFKEENKKDYYSPYRTLLDEILKNLVKEESLFSLIIDNKYYNVDKKFYKNDIIKNIHSKYNGEFSDSYIDIKERNRKVFDTKLFKPFSFFVNSVYNVFLNRFLRGFDIIEEDSILSKKEKEDENIMSFYIKEEILKSITIRIKNLFLNSVPRLKEPLIVRRSLTHDFFEKIGIDEKVLVPENLPIKIIEKGIMSSSLYIHPGFTYNQRKKNEDPSENTKSWLMVLLIPPGIPVFDPENNYYNKAEKELVLPPDLEYEIVSVKKNYKIKNREVYEKIFLNKFNLWENEYKRRIESDKKELNDTINIFFACVTHF